MVKVALYPFSDFIGILKDGVSRALKIKAIDTDTLLETINTKLNDRINTVLTGRTVQDHTFHDSATVPADGAVFNVAGFTTLIVEIYGTSTSRTLDFRGVGPSGATYPIIGELITSEQGLPPAKGTTGTGEVWRFNITGLTSVVVKLAAVAGGNVSVKGKAVA